MTVKRFGCMAINASSFIIIIHSSSIKQNQSLFHPLRQLGGENMRAGGAGPPSLKKADCKRNRVVCLSERSLSVGVAQASGALKSEAVSNMKSLVTAFYSDPPRRIELLEVNEGHGSSCVKHTGRSKCYRESEACRPVLM